MKKVPRGSIGNGNEKVDSAHETCITSSYNMAYGHFSSNNISEINGKKILVIDDDPVLVKLVSEMLEILGYETVSCTSSADGFCTFCGAPDDFDLVITDMTIGTCQ